MKYLSDVGINKAPVNGDLDVDGDIYSNGEKVSTYQPLDYSTSEQDTGQKWIDGKSIYKQTFTGTITSTSGLNNNTVVATVTGLTNVIRQDGFFYIGTGSIYQVIPSADRNERWGAVNRNGTNIRLATQTDQNRVDAPYAVTVWYTKA